MSVAILDPSAGISGDMILGALLDVGVDPGWLRELPARVGFPDVKVQVTRVKRCHLAATKVDFDIPQRGPGSSELPGHTVAELKEFVRQAPVSQAVGERTQLAFDLLGGAEGRAHGVPADAVHLHEVGAVDAVLDIVGAIEGFERLGVDAVYNLPVAIGDGWVQAAHGMLPIPAPAATILLEGFEVRRGAPVEGEATTPTGAVLLRVLSRGEPPEYWRMAVSGWGAGGRDPERYPNALRLIVAEQAAEAGSVEVLATDIDDMQPEYVAPLREALLTAGALDCIVWPTQGKKGRVGLRLEVLTTSGSAERVIEELFANSTTAGVRRWSTLRNTLSRNELRVELSAGIGVRIKVWNGPRGKRCKPEYDDVVRAATELGLPALDVARMAEQRAEAILGYQDKATTTRTTLERRD